MHRILILIQLSIILIGCNALDNPFKVKSVTMTSLCNLQPETFIELERMKFKVPALWADIKPCQAGKIIHDIIRDHKMFSAKALKFINNKYYNLGSIEVEMQGDLNLIGREYENPEVWLIRQKNMWKKSHRDDYPKKRTVQKITINGLNCWKINTSLLNQKYQITSLIGKNIEYVCWEKHTKNYPPIKISAGISYNNDKPVFPYDINKDLILPVFETLTLKKLSKEKYLERVNLHNKYTVDRCHSLIKRYKKYRFNNKYQNISEHSLSLLRECGFDTTSMRKWWCSETIADSKKISSQSQYKVYPEKLTQSLKACSK